IALEEQDMRAIPRRGRVPEDDAFPVGRLKAYDVNTAEPHGPWIRIDVAGMIEQLALQQEHHQGHRTV
ncbi:MAG: hypothetical protein AAGL19_20150, partial [Pseudomonadota bacterium]